MQKIDCFASMLAGFGIGVAASVLFAPAAGDKTRSRIRDTANRASSLFKERAEKFRMSDLKDKANEKIDEAAHATQKAANAAVLKSKEVAHNLGGKMEEEGKRLQGV